MPSPHSGSVSLSPSWRPNRLLLATTLLAASAAATVLGLGSLQPPESRNLALTEGQVKRLAKIQFDLQPEEARPSFQKRTAVRSSEDQIGHAPGTKSAAKSYALHGLSLDHTLALHRAMAAHSGTLGVWSGAAALANRHTVDSFAAMASAEAMQGVLSINGDSQTQPLYVDRSQYQHPMDHGSTEVSRNPVSTFSLDVDTGSYSNARGYIENGQLPPRDSVRLEEFVNYFPYEYPRPQGGHPFGVTTELAQCPWNSKNYLLRIGVRSVDIQTEQLPPANLVFLIDVSGSMLGGDRLPLLQQSLRLLVNRLRPEDRVSIVVYAGREAVLLEPTPGSNRKQILSVIDNLQAGGSTAGEAGIRTAYRLARSAFIPKGINRILLATDGDFNVGISDTKQLLEMIEHERKSGVSLSTLGFGRGNFKDHMMERLADAGNGNYSFIDSLAEGRKVLAQQTSATLHTVAKDVKLQVEFNQAHLREYRLLGYENRALHREDFRNDQVDAGEVGAGATVTALYELTPNREEPEVDLLRYVKEKKAQLTGTAYANELAYLRIRYKAPTEETSRLLEIPIVKPTTVLAFPKASDDLRFASAVAGFAQLLRKSSEVGDLSFRDVRKIAASARGQDEFGYRQGFVELVDAAAGLPIE